MDNNADEGVCKFFVMMISDNKDLVKGFFFYITFSVLGPLFFVGGIGYVLDKFFETNFLVYIFVFVAYVFSNVMMFRKLKDINLQVEKISKDAQSKAHLQKSKKQKSEE